MRFLNNRRTASDLLTYAIVVVAFALTTAAQAAHMVPRSLAGQLVPISCYIVMAVSLNLVVGISGELSLGHAGFMSIGAFTGIMCAAGLARAIPAPEIRLALAMVVGAGFACIAGFLIGIPVMRLRGDYLAIVTLAFGEIIKELINCLLVGVDSDGVHVLINVSGTLGVRDLHLAAGGQAIIKGAQGASGTEKIATFAAGFVLVMVALVVIQNLVRSRTGRAIMAVRDNRIAAQSVGISVTKYRMIAFVVAAALAGASGALFGCNFTQLSASKFGFNTSILVLVFVVLGGLGSMRGSMAAAVVLTVLPEALREFSSYRMLAYAVVLIAVMIIRNSDRVRWAVARLKHRVARTRAVRHV
ncbi:amino acid/amide ABC transporter membrane protein 2, HAAT family [Coriobacterium glomerans PW2]|uniref:Amino acid/amide ABC transporter membrane protein 2, HAAT family n=1 Tax=Coriobacterium glomerans (strain ATCC 49209 / DSM 20642 / JCM 10262 / PW2) TaxID=700015 RepID=F2NBI3_CORGP|nr:branched-chain amino acid ABC transporter permease [Coriobacterium glomerans]AEB06719.1 amino acid/amide ABC transporter membrane protein 2, HAAT family [Coriobacterium glomerans PW2]